MPKLEQFAVILYTLRDHLKTREDALASFDKVAKIGYQSVQVSGMSPDLFPEEELVSVLKERGLSICATHEPGDAILNETGAVIERLQKLQVKYTAYPYPAWIDFTDKASVDGLIKGLDAAGEKMAGAGITLTYHNHALELYRTGGKSILERIYDETAPENLQGELDTHWIQRGGGCVLDWICKLNGRLPLLHIKDFSINEKQEPQFAEIGNGNMNFPAIVAAAEKAGCQHYIVEQDTCPGDPFDSIAQSFDYIKANLAG
jgi:sugar phosphate isomerase/epimerase